MGTAVGLLSSEELEDCDPSLFLGLPALAAFECSMRSVNSTGFVLHDGSCLDLSALEGEGTGAASVSMNLSESEREVMSGMAKLTAMCRQSILCEDDDAMFALRTKIIKASGQASQVTSGSEDDAQANAMTSVALSVATAISQLKFFQEVFMFVVGKLQDLESAAEHLVL